MYRQTDPNELDSSTNEFGENSDSQLSIQISFEEEAEEVEARKRTEPIKRHEASEFVYLKKFETKEEWDDFRQKEKCWSCDGISKSTAQEHTHEQIANKMNDRLKERIIKLYNSNSGFAAQKIRNVFIADGEKFIPKLSQIQSIIRYHCQTKPSKDIIKVGDIVAWAENQKLNHEIDDDTPFVIDFKASTCEDQNKHFQYLISTKRLLANAANYENICVDATYKVVFHGYPLLIIGSIDANRKFHLIAASLSVSETTTDFEFLFEGKVKA